VSTFFASSVATDGQRHRGETLTDVLPRYRTEAHPTARSAPLGLRNSRIAVARLQLAGGNLARDARTQPADDPLLAADSSCGAAIDAVGAGRAPRSWKRSAPCRRSGT
jgi:hypothetical protein